MLHLPVIIGFGGCNAAGRSSNHHAYKRMVIGALERGEAESTYADLAMMMGLVRREGDAVVDAVSGEPIDARGIAGRYGQTILDGTLIRQLEDNLFQPDAIAVHRSASLIGCAREPIRFTVRKTQLPAQLPETWLVEEAENGIVNVTVHASLDVLFREHRSSLVNAGGQLPSGFKPEALYQSRNHPRGLSLSVYGASDAIQSMGIDWELIRKTVKPDQIGCYASSAMGQLDFNGSAGMMQSQLMGRRVSAKQLALGLADMPADFVNAYVLGSVGSTGANLGACATFLYNLRQGIHDIQTGLRRLVVVGSAEAPLTPEVIEGYRTMGALADDESLLALDSGRDTPDYRRAARPFSNNCGFTLAEGAQFLVLCDDALALELGATVHGAVADVFVNADGYKKSIPGPGVGNYVTMAKACALAKAIAGEEALQRRSIAFAHGTSTPQNRVTESHILNLIASTYGIDSWPVAAIKAYVGHTLGPAGGDQIAAALGLWKYGFVPGIKTVDSIAEDVYDQHLDFVLEDREVGSDGIDIAVVNSKGFGGNNASATLLSPSVVHSVLKEKHGAKALTEHAAKNVAVAAASEAYDRATIGGATRPIYRFDHNVIGGEDVSIDQKEIRLPGFEHGISLEIENPYLRD